MGVQLMCGPVCYQCLSRPAMDLADFDARVPRVVVFCSLSCAFNYAVSMIRAGCRFWCYWCRCWVGMDAKGGCVKCGRDKKAAVAAARARGD